MAFTFYIHKAVKGFYCEVYQDNKLVYKKDAPTRNKAALAARLAVPRAIPCEICAEFGRNQEAEGFQQYPDGQAIPVCSGCVIGGSF